MIVQHYLLRSKVNGIEDSRTENVRGIFCETFVILSNILRISFEIFTSVVFKIGNEVLQLMTMIWQF